MSVAAFRAAFKTLGYKECNTVQYDDQQEKVALFCKSGVPTHAARQLDATFWTSKLGQDLDMSHELHALSGNAYGEVSEILGRVKSV